MTEFEIITLVINIVSVVFIFTGLLYAGIQIALLKRVHKENHDWNRRIETQKVLNEYDRTRKASDLYKAFGHVDAKHPIPLDKVLSEFRENSDLEFQCHALLNEYESIAIGIHKGIYDGDIVRDARKTTIIRTYTAYKEYIAFRQRENNSSIYKELEALVSDWLASDAKAQVKNQLGTLK